MSRMAILIIAAFAVSLIFVSGCKDKPTPDAEPTEIVPVEKQPDGDSDPVNTENPVKDEEPVKEEVIAKDEVAIKDEVAVKDEDPVTPVKPETVVSEEKKTEIPEVPVVSSVSDKTETGEDTHDVWMTDYNAAMKKAAAEKKDLLLDFSGSDWCGWCIKLDNEVFSQKEFIEPASKDFVFVLLDFPQDKTKTTPQLQEQNNELRKKYPIQGFPTVYLTDYDGKPYAITGYQKGGAKAYYEHISKFRQANVKAKSFIAKADSELEDVEKAKLLDQAVSLMAPEIVEKFYPNLTDRIIALDSENQAGLRDNYLARRALRSVAQNFRERNVDEAFKLINNVIGDFETSGSTAQDVYYYKAMILDARKDKAGALENLKKSIAVDPKSIMAEDIRTIIKKYFSEPETESSEVPGTEPAVEKVSE